MNKRDLIKYATLSASLGMISSKAKADTFKNKTVVTPEMFGAIGNGIVDDSLSFQNAINYAIKNKCKLYLINEYHITQTLDFYGEYTLGYRLSMQGVTDKAKIKYSGLGVCLNVGSFGIDFKDFNITSDSSNQSKAIALKVSGSNGSIKNISVIGYWMIAYWLIDFSNSYVEHCKDFGIKDNIIGISWLINSCVNTSFNSNYTVYRNYGYLLEPPNIKVSNDINKATVSNYKRHINWGCEGLSFNSIKTIWCNHGIYSRGIAISFNSCVIDLCHKYILRWYAEANFSNCWFAMSKISSMDEYAICSDKISTIVSFMNNHLSYHGETDNKHRALFNANAGVFIGNIADGIDVEIASSESNKIQSFGNIAINHSFWKD